MTRFRPASLLAIPLFALLFGCQSPRSTGIATVGAAPSPPPSATLLADPSESEPYGKLVQRELALRHAKATENDVLSVADLYDTLGQPEEGIRTILNHAPPRTSVAVPMTLARLQVKLGDFTSARRTMVSVLPAFSTLDPETKHTVLRTLLLAGDGKTAARFLSRSSSDPEDIALLGLERFVSGDPSGAALLFKKAAATRPDDAWYRFLAGMAFRSAGAKSDAIAVWKTVVNQSEPPPESVTGLADLLADNNNFEEAERTLHLLSRKDVNTAEYWQVTERIEKHRSKTVAAALARGYAAFHAGNPRGAETIWQNVAPRATGEDQKEVFAALYNSAFKREDAEAARRWADAALAAFPRDPYFLKRRAEVLLGQGQIKEALADALTLQGVAGNDQHYEAAELLCRIALDGGDEGLLQKNVRLAQNVRRSDPDPLLHLAEWNEKKIGSPGSVDAAIGYYQQAIQIDPHHADAYAHMGLLEADRRQIDAATKDLLHALSLSPTVLEGAPHAQLAQLYQRQRRPEEAAFHVRQYQRLRRIKERWPTLLKALRQDRPVAEWKELAGMALLRRENWIARCAIHRALELAPGDPSVSYLLASLEKREGHFEAALTAVLRGRQLEGRARGTVVPKQ